MTEFIQNTTGQRLKNSIYIHKSYDGLIKKYQKEVDKWYDKYDKEISNNHKLIRKNFGLQILNIISWGIIVILLFNLFK